MTSSPSNPAPRVPPAPVTTALQVRPGGWPAILCLLVLVGVAVVAALFFTGHLMLRPDPNSIAGKELALQELAEQNVEFAHTADSARNKVSWDAAQSKLLAAQSAYRKLPEARSKLDTQLKQLATGAEGQRLASREAWVDQYIVVQDHQRLTAEEVATQGRAIQTLLPVCQQALKAKIVLDCDATLRTQVETIHQQLTQEAKQVEEDLHNLVVLVSAAQAASPAEQTLTLAVAARKEAQRTQSLAQLAVEQERQRREIEQAARERQLVAERESLAAQRAAEQQIRDAEAAREKIEQAQRIAAAKAKSDEAQRLLKQAEAKRLAEQNRQARIAKFEAALPNVKSLLTPFISNGRMLYVAGQGWREAEPGPQSLAGIKSTGGLKDEQQSWYMITALGMRSQTGNDRPLGSFPESNFNAERDARRVQTFLREYGDLLVERGMLRP